MSSKSDTDAAVLIAIAVVETVRACDDGLGVPGGHLYAGLMSVLNLEAFETLMETLVRTGILRKDGHCYHFNQEVLVKT